MKLLVPRRLSLLYSSGSSARYSDDPGGRDWGWGVGGRKEIYVYITDSLGCVAESKTNIVKQLYSNNKKGNYSLLHCFSRVHEPRPKVGKVQCSPAPLPPQDKSPPSYHGQQEQTVVQTVSIPLWPTLVEHSFNPPTWSMTKWRQEWCRPWTVLWRHSYRDWQELQKTMKWGRGGKEDS